MKQDTRFVEYMVIMVIWGAILMILFVFIFILCVMAIKKVNGLKSYIITYCDIQYENIVKESNKHYDKITKEIESTNSNTSKLLKLMAEINGKIKT